MKVHNYMENEVDVLLKELLKNYSDVCQCEHCLADIKALALNELKPHYVVTHKGELYTKLNEFSQQFEVDIYKALIDAIKVVKEKPHHEK